MLLAITLVETDCHAHSTIAYGAAALFVSMSANYAGPCSQEIDRVQAEIDAKLNSKRATARHVRPTPMI
jgi:hypothetical protein